MATWVEQLKTTLWDGEVIRNDPDSRVVFIGVTTTPWPRQFWNEHRAEIKKGCSGVFFVIVGAFVLHVLGLR